MTPLHPYEEQIARAKRSYERLKLLNSGLTPISSADNYIDDVMAFFMFCFHIRDHLIYDPAYKTHDRQQIDAHIKATDALALCADICNGIKHLKLDRPWTGEQPKITGRVFELGLNENLSGPAAPGTLAIKIKIEHDGKTLDAFQIATDAMNAWDAFIK